MPGRFALPAYLLLAAPVFSQQNEAPAFSVKDADRGIQLAMQGNCPEALPLLDAAMRNPGYNNEFKHTVGLAGVNCSMLLNRQADAMSFLAWLEEAYPRDPEVLFVAVHEFSE